MPSERRLAYASSTLPGAAAAPDRSGDAPSRYRPSVNNPVDQQHSFISATPLLQPLRPSIDRLKAAFDAADWLRACKQSTDV
jgi:hypothetical protein